MSKAGQCNQNKVRMLALTPFYWEYPFCVMAFLMVGAWDEYFQVLIQKLKVRAYKDVQEKPR